MKAQTSVVQSWVVLRPPTAGRSILAVQTVIEGQQSKAQIPSKKKGAIFRVVLLHYPPQAWRCSSPLYNVAVFVSAVPTLAFSTDGNAATRTGTLDQHQQPASVFVFYEELLLRQHSAVSWVNRNSPANLCQACVRFCRACPCLCFRCVQSNLFRGERDGCVFRGVFLQRGDRGGNAILMSIKERTILKILLAYK
jgi:hypothetical protein